MTDYISHVADLLEQGTPVIFYTVSSCTFGYVRELKNRFCKKPTAICDGDVNKQGKTYRGLEDIQIISPQEAMGRFTDGYFFICSQEYKYEIIAYLTDVCKIIPKRILNYVPVKKVRSCVYIQKCIDYNLLGDLGFCCMGIGPVIKNNDDVDIKAYLDLRNTLLKKLEDPKTLTHTSCDNCSQICERYYPETPLSWHINYCCYNHCNYKCSYCNIWNHKWENGYNGHKGEQSLGYLIEKFKEAKVLSQDYSVALTTAGEPTIHPKRKEFYRAFDGIQLVVSTNGFKFDVDLYEVMQTKKVLINCSIDAGTPETYAKIKGVDGFAQVRKNMAQYAKAATGIVALKYIMIPDVNDNYSDIDGFIELCVETNASIAIVSLDYNSMDKVTPQVAEMVQRLKNGLNKYHIFSIPQTVAWTSEHTDLMKNLWQ